MANDDDALVQAEREMRVADLKLAQSQDLLLKHLEDRDQAGSAFIEYRDHFRTKIRQIQKMRDKLTMLRDTLVDLGQEIQDDPPRGLLRELLRVVADG